MARESILPEFSLAVKAGDYDRAVALMRTTADISPTELERFGDRLCKSLSLNPPPAPLLHIRIIGQTTSHWIRNVLTACAWRRNVRITVSESLHDNVFQDVSSLASSGSNPDVVILLPWTNRLFASGDRGHESRVQDELDFWHKVWSTLATSSRSRILQVGYDWQIAGPLGLHLSGMINGNVGLVRDVNLSLRRNLPKGAYFLDLEQISGILGRTAFYDMRMYHWTKQPFSNVGLAHLCKHMAAALQAMTSGPKKVLVLDLDNTLWGGVVGETGPMGVSLGEGPEGEAFSAFQRYVLELSKRGILLAVASKNNLSDAQEPFRSNPAMVLKLEDFAAFEAHWNPKATSLGNIAKTLNLGLNSFVFFDDNPVEREHIRQFLPDVEVIDVPEEPADYVRALENALFFEATSITSEDRQRTARYKVEQQRKELQSTLSVEEYLQSLDMKAEVAPIYERNIERVVQLLGKTNQFNLTTRRHCIEDLKSFLAQPGSIHFTLQLTDRFGEYGLIAVLIALPDKSDASGKTLRIDTWLMSCRVIGRGVERFTLRILMDQASSQGYSKIIGEYRPTAKNVLVKDLYSSLGFKKIKDESDSVIYSSDVGELPLVEDYIRSV